VGIDKGQAQALAENESMFELWEFMTPEERANIDSLIWSPEKAVQRYKYDAVAFAREVLHMTLAPYQEKVLRLLVETHRVCFRSLHSAGKTTTAAAAILWFIGVWEECKIPTTASAWRQLKDFLWPEIHKWALKADWWRVGIRVRPGKELMKLRIEIGDTENRFAFAISSNDEAKIEGAHSAAILYVFDEAKAIVPAIWDAAEGALGTPNAYALALSTPGDSSGRFFEIQTDRDKYRAWSVVAATIDEVIAAGRTTQEWLETRAREWGIESAMYKRRALGQFADESGDVLIPLHLVEAAIERWHVLNDRVSKLIEDGTDPGKADAMIWGDLSHIGVDPARFGVDKTGWAFRYGDHIRKVDRTDQQDTMQTTGKMVSHMQHNTALAKIDVNGLGAGVFDRGRELWSNGELRKPKEKKVPLIPINTANGTKSRDKSGEMSFNRLRDYLWWHVRELLEADNATIALPPDENLTRDLTAPKWGMTSSGKVKIEEKEETKARLGRSPDVGDAVVLSLAPDVMPYKPLFATI
jgi:hypothetical protein